MSRDPVPLSSSLGGVVRSLRPPKHAAGSTSSSSGLAGQLAGVFGRWNEAVGDAVAAHVQPVRWGEGCLVVEVDEPAWATQLKFFESTMRDRLREVASIEVERFEIRVRRR